MKNQSAIWQGVRQGQFCAHARRCSRQTPRLLTSAPTCAPAGPIRARHMWDACPDRFLHKRLVSLGLDHSLSLSAKQACKLARQTLPDRTDRASPRSSPSTQHSSPFSFPVRQVFAPTPQRQREYSLQSCCFLKFCFTSVVCKSVVVF